MLKPKSFRYRGEEVSLECVHKDIFPPPQTKGLSEEDLDVLWKRGAIKASDYSQLKVWHQVCGLDEMDRKCVDCPLALHRKGRPGRPHVIETQQWLPMKRDRDWSNGPEKKP